MEGPVLQADPASPSMLCMDWYVAAQSIHTVTDWQGGIYTIDKTATSKRKLKAEIVVTTKTVANTFRKDKIRSIVDQRADPIE